MKPPFAAMVFASKADTEVRAIIEDRGDLRVYASRDLNVSADLVLVAVGVQPNADDREEGGSSHWSERCASREPSHGNRCAERLCSRRLR